MSDNDLKTFVRSSYELSSTLLDPFLLIWIPDIFFPQLLSNNLRIAAAVVQTSTESGLSWRKGFRGHLGHFNVVVHAYLPMAVETGELDEGDLEVFRNFI